MLQPCYLSSCAIQQVLFVLADEEEVPGFDIGALISLKVSKKKSVAVSDDEDEDSDSGDESDASEDYDPANSDDDVAVAPANSTRCSNREHKAKTSIQLVLDSDDDCPADVSPVGGDGKPTEDDEDNEPVVADGDKEEPVDAALTWPSDVRKRRSARSRSSHSVSDASTPGSLSLASGSRNLAEQQPAMTMSGGSVKRGCNAIDHRSQQQNEPKRLRLDLSEEASKAGMTVEEMHALVALQPAEEDDHENAADIECMVRCLLHACIDLVTT